jgi:hypothetical protein
MQKGIEGQLCTGWMRVSVSGNVSVLGSAAGRPSALHCTRFTSAGVIGRGETSTRHCNLTMQLPRSAPSYRLFALVSWGVAQLSERTVIWSVAELLIASVCARWSSEEGFSSLIASDIVLDAFDSWVSWFLAGILKDEGS